MFAFRFWERSSFTTKWQTAGLLTGSSSGLGTLMLSMRQLDITAAGSSAITVSDRGHVQSPKEEWTTCAFRSPRSRQCNPIAAVSDWGDPKPPGFLQEDGRDGLVTTNSVVGRDFRQRPVVALSSGCPRCCLLCDQDDVDGRSHSELSTF